MTLNTQTTRTARSTFILVAFLISIFYNPLSSKALGNDISLPSLAEFSRSVQNGEAQVLRGVYVSDVLALPVVQQPAALAGFVSGNDSELTQFRMAAQYGTIGLLAHNYLAGKVFPQLTAGQEVSLVYGDGKIQTFIITEVLRFQALQPTSPYSSFRNLEKEETLTAEQMFKRVYFGDQRVTFQTCIEANGNSSWGRLFVIATPKPFLSGVGETRY